MKFQSPRVGASSFTSYPSFVKIAPREFQSPRVGASSFTDITQGPVHSDAFQFQSPRVGASSFTDNIVGMKKPPVQCFNPLVSGHLHSPRLGELKPLELSPVSIPSCRGIFIHPIDRYVSGEIPTIVSIPSCRGIFIHPPYGVIHGSRPPCFNPLVSGHLHSPHESEEKRNGPPSVSIPSCRGIFIHRDVSISRNDTDMCFNPLVSGHLHSPLAISLSIAALIIVSIPSCRGIFIHRRDMVLRCHAGIQFQSPRVGASSFTKQIPSLTLLLLQFQSPRVGASSFTRLSVCCPPQ